MDAETKRKLRPILAASKEGRMISDAESDFAEKCWKQWPDEYRELRREIANEAARRLNPFWKDR